MPRGRREVFPRALRVASIPAISQAARGPGSWGLDSGRPLRLPSDTSNPMRVWGTNLLLFYGPARRHLRRCTILADEAFKGTTSPSCLGRWLLFAWDAWAWGRGPWQQPRGTARLAASMLRKDAGYLPAYLGTYRSYQSLSSGRGHHPSLPPPDRSAEMRGARCPPAEMQDKQRWFGHPMAI